MGNKSGSVSNAIALEGFYSPRRGQRGLFFWGGLVTGFGTLGLLGVIALLAAACLMVGSYKASRDFNEQASLAANTTVIAKSHNSESETPAAPKSDFAKVASADTKTTSDDAKPPYQSFFDDVPLVFSSAVLAPRSDIAGSAGRLTPSLTASLLPSDARSDRAAGASQNAQNPLGANAGNNATRVAAVTDEMVNLPPLPPRRNRQKAAEASGRTAPVMLASAGPDVPALSTAPKVEAPAALPGLTGRTAVYDIAAHTVYMPNGERLEAHSGLGNRLDDIRYVSEKNRGPTPPHIYDLKLRESLFHGVQAVRLNPVGGDNPFGRTGLLAHTYMLGPRGDSNGCVSFKDYPKFLRAVENGDVTRMVVVTHWKDAPPAVASNGISKFFRTAFGSL